MSQRTRLNEEEIKVKIVLPLLNELGFDPSALQFERFLRASSGRRQYVDIVVTADDVPIFLVETKAEDVDPAAPTVIEQAVNYCRSFARVVPYALLTNGTEAVLVNALDKSVVFAGGPETVLTSARALERDVLVSITEAMRRTSLSAIRRLSPQSLLECAAKQSRRELGLLSADASASGRIADAKYIERLFVERPAIETQFSAFRNTSSKVFALIGNAGMGKTNLLCWLGGQLQGSVPVLFYNGMSLDRGLTDALLTDLRAVVSARTLSSLVDRIRAECSQNVFLFIDALNECIDGRATLRSELNELVASESPIRVVVSCRTLDWDYWCRNDRGMLNHLGRAVFVPSAHGSVVSETRGVALGELTSHEFDQAWARYHEAFELSGALTPRMVAMCKEPFMLRLVAEVFRGGTAIPDYVEPIELFRRYFEEKIASKKDRLAAQRVLSSLAAQIVATRLPRVPIDALPSGCTETLHRLLDESIILFVQDRFIYFHFELFLEYVVAQYLISEHLTAGDTPTFIASLTASDLLNMPGIVENVLLIADVGPAQLAASLRWLAGHSDDRWRAIACSIVKRLRTHPEEIATAITMLASDDNYVIRMFLAQSLAPFVRQHGMSILRILADSDRWESRESAALALGNLDTSDSGCSDVLQELADDFHWRVRRAAGYALHRNWTSAGTSHEVRLRLHRASITRSWRSKYSLCIALLGSRRELDSDERTLVLELAQDENPQVRWAVAHYLPRLAGASASPIVPLLCHDKQAWIRRKLAESLISLYGAGDHSVADILGRLAQDSDFSVRVTMARRGERIADQWFVQLLERYRQAEEEPDVRVAAAYTLELLGFECFEAVASDAVGSRMLDVYRCRERIGRRDLDPAHARFSAVQEYIGRRTEFQDRRDPYMRTIDAMCSLIAAASAALGRQNAALLNALAADCDEEIRWALVLFLTNFGLAAVPYKLREMLLRKLAKDSHWWVRREVAAALASMAATSSLKRTGRLLERIRKAEIVRGEPCGDEVLYFAGP